MNHPTDKEIDSIYNLIDSFIGHSKWDLLDAIFILVEYNAKEIHLDLLLAFATASLYGKNKILSRPDFIKKCKKLYPDYELWKGLE